jgi:hypothetical protein
LPFLIFKGKFTAKGVISRSNVRGEYVQSVVVARAQEN